MILAAVEHPPDKAGARGGIPGSGAGGLVLPVNVVLSSQAFRPGVPEYLVLLVSYARRLRLQLQRDCQHEPLRTA